VRTVEIERKEIYDLSDSEKERIADIADRLKPEGSDFPISVLDMAVADLVAATWGALLRDTTYEENLVEYCRKYGGDTPQEVIGQMIAGNNGKSGQAFFKDSTFILRLLGKKPNDKFKTMRQEVSALQKEGLDRREIQKKARESSYGVVEGYKYHGPRR
jgi:hypothetical protein